MLLTWKKRCRNRIRVYIHIYFFKIVKAIVQQRGCIRESTVCRIQYNCDQNGIASLRISYEGISGHVCITGLTSENSVVSVGLTGHHSVVIEKVTGF